MQDQRTINQIPEVSHNQAMLTLVAERQELLSLRGRCADLEQAQEAAQAVKSTLEKAVERILELEKELACDEEQVEEPANTKGIDWGASPERRLAFLKECVESGSPVEIENPSGSKTTGVIRALKDDYTQLEFMDGATFQISKICHFEKISDATATDEEQQDNADGQ